MKAHTLIGFACLLLISSCNKENDTVPEGNGATDSLKINQMQVIASHNSYHETPDSAILAFMVRLDSIGILPSQFNPRELDYNHLSLEAQMSDHNVRGLEIDIYNDPQGGQFYNRQGLGLIGLPVASGIEELNQPGFKVLHIPDFDYNTNTYTFKSALTSIKNWSDAHPNHIPIFINVETKNDGVAEAAPMLNILTKSIPFNAQAADNIDVEIKSVFGENLDKVITPDDVRGSYATLEAAVLAGNWPRLSESRGKVVFIMQGGAESFYKSGHPSLQGRAMFMYAKPGEPEAAFVILNDSEKDKAAIQQRVGQGYIVRTRADGGTSEARTGDYSDRDAAFESWAQIVSTDYYIPDRRAGTPGWSNYQVQFPNGELARINGISASDKQNLGTIKE